MTQLYSLVNKKKKKKKKEKMYTPLGQCDGVQYRYVPVPTL